MDIWQTLLNFNRIESTIHISTQGASTIASFLTISKIVVVSQSQELKRVNAFRMLCPTHVPDSTLHENPHIAGSPRKINKKS